MPLSLPLLIWALVPSVLADMAYLGYVNVPTAVCGQQYSLALRSGFSQTCGAGGCPAITWALSPLLQTYGLYVDATGMLSGTVSLSAPSQLQTTVTANDGVSAFGQLQIPVSCSSTFTGVIPDVNAKSQVPFTLTLSTYFTLPANLQWSIEGATGSQTLVASAINSAGVLTFTPNSIDTQLQPYRVRIIATSGGTQTASNYFNVNVAPAGVKLVGTLLPQFANEGAPYSASFADYFTDPDRNVLTYSLKIDGAALSASSGLVFNSQTATLSGTPSASFAVTHTLVVCANNNKGQVDVCQTPASLIVAPRVKQAPTCDNVSPPSPVETGQDIILNYAAYCRDPANQVLSYTFQTPLPAGSGLFLSGSTLRGTYNNVDAANSPLTVSVVVKNTDALSVVVSFTVTVRVKNNPPMLTALAGQAQTAYTMKPFTLSIGTWFSDPDAGDILTYRIDPVMPANSGIRFLNGDFSGTPNDQDLARGLYSMTVVATDNAGATASSFLYITVLKGNRAPTALPLTGMPATILNVPWQWNINPFFNDQDGDRLVYTLTGQPTGSGLVPVSNDGILRGTFNAADQTATRAGPVTVTITADDQRGGTVTSQFSYSVIVPPQCTMPLSSEVPLGYVGVRWNFTVAKYCTSTSNSLTYSLQPLHAGNNFQIDSRTGLISGVISDADLAKSSFAVKYTVNDGAGGISNNTFTVFVVQSVAPVVLDCAAPSKCYIGYSCGQNASQCFNGQGETLIYSMTGQPLGSLLTINRNTGVISGQVSSIDAQSQPLHLIVTADNQKGGISTKDLYYTIQSPQPISLLPIGVLPDLVCGTTCCSWNPRDYVVNPTDGRVNYTLLSRFPTASNLRLLPTGDFAGVASVVDVRASPLTVSIAISNDQPSPPVNFLATFNVIGTPAPLAIPGRPIPPQDVKILTPWQFDVTAYFKLPTGISSRYTMSGAPASLSINANTGVITGTLLASDYTGSAQTVTVTADDTNECGGGTLSLTFTLTVNPDNKPPIVKLAPDAPPMMACEGADLKVCVCDWFTDPKNLKMTYSIKGLANNTKLSFVSSTGLLTGKPGAVDTDTTGDSITVCATNSVALTTCFSRQVLFDRGQRPPIADPPIPSPVTAIQGQRFVGYFNFHFFEADGQPLIYSIAGLPVGSGLGIGPITGIFSGTPNEADFRASPLVLSVFASNEQNVPSAARCSGGAGRARADFIAIVEKPKGNPICQGIPPSNSAFQVGQFWVMDVSRSFTPGVGATKLEYALRGLPRGSGLTIDPRSGVISGIVSTVDAAARPLSFFVAVTNGNGQCQSQFTISGVLALPAPGSQACPVNVQNIPNQNAAPGRFFTVDLSTFFQPTLRVQLIYAVSGLPAGTGFFIDAATGILSGVSTSNDNNMGTIPLVTTVTCGPSSPPMTRQWNLIISSCTACQNNGGCAQRCIVQDPLTCRPVCSCNTGVLAPDGRSCQTGNACDMNNGGCEKFCTIANGSPVCSCPPNWNLGPDGKSCQYNACGSNNGGCEQLCISVGQNLKCDCRTGTLQADGRSCSGSLITVGTIPPALVIGCQYFVFDFSTAMKYSGKGTLAFTLVGVPPSSGFKITSSGLLSGTPTLSDCATAQPMTLTVTATDGSAKVSAVMFMSAFCDRPSGCPPSGVAPQPVPTLSTTSQVAPIYSAPQLPMPVSSPAPSTPLLWAVVCVDFKFDVTPYFQNVENPAQYVILGLGVGTGLSMQSNGVLAGTPTASDCAMSPMTLTVICNDAAGRQSKMLLNVKFLSCDCAAKNPIMPLQVATNTPLYSHTTCKCGQPFMYDASNMFASQFKVNSLQYSVQGIPDDSGLSITDSGVLSGSPNSNILKSANPIRAKVVGTDAYGKAMHLVLTIDVSGDCSGIAPQQQQATLANGRSSLSRAPTDGNEGIVPIQVVGRNVSYVLNMSRIAFCASCDNSPIEYKASLPASSGLTFSRGAFTGSASNADCAFQPQPMRVNVTAWQRGAQKAETKVMFSFVCSANTSNIPVLSGSLPAATGVLSSLLYYNAAPLMGGASLNFSVFGIMPASNLKMSSSGVLSGVPTEVDMNGPPLLVTAMDASGNSAQATLQLTIAKSGVSSSIIFLPIKPVEAFKGQYFQLNVAQRFYDDAGRKLAVSLEGIPRGSGLSFDQQSGVLSGTPNDVDLRQYQPLRFLVSAQVNDTKKTGEVYVNCLSDQPQKDNAAVPPANSNRAPASTSIKRQVAVEGEPFLFGVASSFLDQDGDVLTYSLEDLPEGTGLRIDAISGIISGTPTRSDSLVQQPLHVVVAATDPNGLSTAETFLLTVFQGARRSVNRAPVASQIDPIKALSNKSFTVSIASSFADADGDVLTYSVSGLPKNTGCHITNSGEFGGVPTSADLAASPMMIVVTVSDGIAQVQSSFNFTVVDGQGQNQPPTSKTMPQLRLGHGDSLRFAAKQYFTDPDGNRLTFQVVGLPKGTGFTLDAATGVLSGVPTDADFAAKQPMVVGFVANDGMGGRAGEILYIRLADAGFRSIQESDFDLDGISKSVVEAGVPQVTVEVGTWVLFNARQYFPSYGDSGVSVAYSIRGLPLGSGFQINSASGVVSGTANAADAAAAQKQPGKALPVTITCTFKMAKTSTPVDQVILLKFGSDDGHNRAPFAQTIPNAFLQPSGSVLVNAWTSFSDPDEDELTFSVLGLPQGSGLSMISSSGVLFGTPSEADLAVPQPMVLTVVCEDSHGNKVQEALMLDVSKTAPTLRVKSCEELGWPVSSTSTGCSRSPKTAGACPAKLSFDAANDLCVGMGARLCTSQELLNRRVQDSSECTFGTDVMWTSSNCAFGDEVLVQDRRSAVGRQCQNKTSGFVARVTCCGESRPVSAKPVEVSTTVTKELSAKTCEELSYFALNPVASSRTVCSTAKPSKLKCATETTYDQARATCQAIGARLCTTAELDDHVALSGGCNLDNKRVWSSTTCPENQVSTQAGSPTQLSKFPKKCTSTSDKLGFHCCADFKEGTAFDRLQVSPALRSAQLTWSWPAYKLCRVSYQKVASNQVPDSSKWTVAGKDVVATSDGKFVIRLTDLQSSSLYAVQVVPLKKRNRVTEIKSQSVQFVFNTTMDAA